jgi:hypothetical protein
MESFIESVIAAALSLSWSIPVAREDGTAMSVDEIDGYAVYIGGLRQPGLIPAADTSAEFPDIDYGCFKMTTFDKASEDKPSYESKFSNEICKGTRPTFPVILRGDPPEQRTITLAVEKPGAATEAAITLSVFDADFPDEGTLSINGSAPIDLFGDEAVFDEVDADITIEVPVAYWVDGDNTLLFTHDKTGGYVVNGMTVDFIDAGSIDPKPPVMTE